jgi:hypothetical protein
MSSKVIAWPGSKTGSGIKVELLLDDDPFLLSSPCSLPPD